MTGNISNDPLWFKDVIIYQLHIKSFFDSNDDGYGDFPGLLQKLDYLEDLGINCIWLLPFYPSPLKDDGYDIADYEGINPVYGNIKDFRAFVKEAHKRNIRVVTELVINHTSDQHPWFQAARQAPPGSKKRDFYVWSDTDQLYKDARIIFLDYEKSNWTWDPVAEQFYWHRFYSHQPDLNFENPQVFEGVANVMRFWLDMGVDGMRLDAIPYLIERDGTNCENLPETHTVLKNLRAVMDNEYQSRVFLAEANQWPSDVRAYFGNGDECHMAFHFPVMPRIFMAVHQEDRHPIVDILRQTPEIPDNCQWAMFLRNHDELTLEMVTAEERDYMYTAYAHDPMMRINLGIRRRLAPLLQYSRPRIELLNAILLSMHGTPIIYYGDEIGMGDNIFLGDRHGVRTPMQWNSDRNGGFSRAFFAKLYSPPNMDPITGYQTTNVESQQLDPSSLLNWMKSIIKLRKQYQVFGRGDLIMLEPSNRKVLAYLRKYDGETVLVVANLSRHPQSATLELPDYIGKKPIEMFGLEPFHPIEGKNYTVTLSAHGFYWLLLETSKPIPMVAQPTVQEEKVAEAPVKSLSYDTDFSVGWTSLMGSGFRDLLESEVLPEYIRRQRWFGKKTKQIKTVRIADWIGVSHGGANGAILIAETTYTGEATDLFSIFASIALGEDAEKILQTAPETILAHADGHAVIHDGLEDENFCRALYNILEQNKRQASESGFFEGFTGPTYQHMKPDAGTELKRMKGEQSNSSLRVGQQLMLKLFRRLEPGVHPDFEIGRTVRNIDGFANVPAVAGIIEYRPQDTSDFYTFALLQEYVANQGDGWTYTIEEFRRFYERASAANPAVIEKVAPNKPLNELIDSELPVELFELLGVYLKDAQILGKRTGELHSILGKPTKNSAFKPEPISKDDLIDLSFAIKSDVNKAMQLLERSHSTLPDDVKEPCAQLRQLRGKIGSFIDRMPTIYSKVQKIRCHGDYHLGQTLYSNGDFIIIDFEGEPAKPLSQRRQKSSPLRDVAGMLRSFSYAAYASLLLFTHNRPEDYNRLLPWTKVLEKWVSVAFLNGYFSATTGQPFLPKDRNDFFRLLLPYMVEKGFYEVTYELNNRPDWIKVPVNSLLDYLQETLVETER